MEAPGIGLCCSVCDRSLEPYGCKTSVFDVSDVFACGNTLSSADAAVSMQLKCNPPPPFRPCTAEHMSDQNPPRTSIPITIPPLTRPTALEPVSYPSLFGNSSPLRNHLTTLFGPASTLPPFHNPPGEDLPRNPHPFTPHSMDLRYKHSFEQFTLRPFPRVSTIE